MYIVQKVHLSYQYLREVKCARAGDLNETTTTAIKMTTMEAAAAAAMAGFLWRNKSIHIAVAQRFQHYS